MERGSKPAKVKTDARPPVAGKSRKTGRSTGRQLEQRLAATLEQQTATSEILRVISNSPTDLQPVFDAIVGSAARLFQSSGAAIQMLEGNRIYLRAAAGRGQSAEAPRKRDFGTGRVES